MADGFLNLLKAPGMSSHDVVAHVRRVLQTKKVGHAGTLDPASAGVLPVALGKATRLIEYMAGADKAYRAELTFGVRTDSGDDTGRVIERCENFTMPDEAALREALAAFRGAIEQTPPMHSAIKIGGKRLYELARQGQSVERPRRRVVIHAISFLKCGGKTLLFDVTCSKGTYIRSLCMDIGARLHLPATMSFLVRTRVGSFSLSDAVTLEELQEMREKALLPPDAVVGHLQRVCLDKAQAASFCQGQRLCWPEAAAEAFVRVYDAAEAFVGIGRLSGAELMPVKVLRR